MQSKDTKLPLKWLAPEVLQSSQFRTFRQSEKKCKVFQSSKKLGKILLYFELCFQRHLGIWGIIVGNAHQGLRTIWSAQRLER